jgi:hypothetical protein
MSIVLNRPARADAGRRLPRMVDEPGVRLGLAYVAIVLATLLCGVLHLSPGIAIALLVLAAVGCARTLPVSWAMLSGLSAWAFWNGFIENRTGQLTLAAHDVALMAVAVLAALVGSLSSRRSR